MDKKTDSSEERNTNAALAYVLGPITGIYFLVTSKDGFVKFNAMQSIVLCVFWFTLTIIFSPFTSLVSLGFFMIWLLAIYRSWKGEKWEIPVVSGYVKKIIK